MTTIVGLVEGKAVWLAADRQVSTGWSAKRFSATGKIVSPAPHISIATTGNLSSITALRNWLDLPRYVSGDDKERWVSRELWPAVIRAHKSAGFIDDKARELESAFLVALDGSLFGLYYDGSILDYEGGLGALGSGSDVAIGAMIATMALGLSAEDRVRMAIVASEAADCYTGGKIDVVCVDPSSSATPVVARDTES